MTDDETFAHRLSARADLVVPTFEIDPERVARRARSRRMATRSASVTAVAVVAVVAGAWAAPGVGWPALPQRPQEWTAGTGETAPASPPPSPSPSPTVVPDATPSASAAPTYWYSRTETTSPYEGPTVRESGRAATCPAS